MGEPAKRGEQGLAGVLEGADRTGGRSCRVVDLVRQPGGQCAEGDERLALSCRRLDAARSAVQALDEVPTEREPGARSLPQHLGRHPEHPPLGDAPTGREIDPLLVPGAEPAGPATGHVHPPDHVVLAAEVAYELDGSVDEHEPEVRVLALVEQGDAGLDPQLGAGLDQLGQLVVGQPVEEVERAEVVDAHQIVAR